MADIYWIENSKVMCGDAQYRPPNCPLTTSAPSPYHNFDGTNWVLPSDTYKEQRRLAYPTMGEQLDAILKQLYLMRSKDINMPIDPDMQSIIDKWMSVKALYPKVLI